jgi:hypothetical protein
MLSSNRSGHRLSRAAHCLLGFVMVGASVITTSFIAESSSSAATPSTLPWVQQSPATMPPGSSAGSMAYDQASGQLVLLGGFGDLNDTWTYDGATWIQQSPSSSPAARGIAQMAYDGSTNKMVFFGGFSDGTATNDDMWVYPGSSQSLAFTSTAPTLGIRGGATYAPTATSSSGLDVSESLDADSTGCTFAGTVVTFTGAGTCVIDANQAGNDQFAPAPHMQQSIAVASPGPYSPIDPIRICDTRAGNPSNLTGAATQCDGLTIQAAGSRIINVANGSLGVPADATAVALNVTVVNPVGPGFVTAYPTGAPLPNTSSVNYVANDVVPNLVEVGIGTAGQVSIYSSAQTDVVVDVEGYVAPTASGGSGAGLYNPLPSPVRICDTRSGNPSGLSAPNDQCNGMTLAAGSTLPIKAADIDGIPTGATAAVFNVTVANPTAAGFLTVYPEGGTAPLASNVNYASGKVTSNRVAVPLSVGGAHPGEISLLSSAAADVVVDVSGYYTAAGGTGAQFTAEPAPVRICDTRVGNPSMLRGSAAQCNGSPIGEPGGELGISSLQVTGLAGVPSNAKAVVVNLTGVAPSAATFLKVFPSDMPIPPVSDLNLVPGDVKANLVVATLSSTGAISILNAFGSIDVVVDVLGWYS